MKCYNKSILLIACMVIFLLIGAVSANKNDTISNVGMDDNTLLGSVNQSCDLGSQQNNIVNQVNNLIEHNLSSEVNNSGEFNNSSSIDKSFDDLQNTINDLSNNSVLDLDCDYTYSGTCDFTGITINKTNFTIDGHGYTLDAKSSSNSHVRIFNVTGTNIILKNLGCVNLLVGISVFSSSHFFSVAYLIKNTFFGSIQFFLSFE